MKNRFALFLVPIAMLAGCLSALLPVGKAEEMAIGLLRPNQLVDRLDWKVICKTPAGYVPQGLTTHGKELLLSAYKGREEKSSVFRLVQQGNDLAFEFLWDMPPEAKHTSGLASIPGRPDLLLAVDYRSNRVYLLNVAESRVGKKANVRHSIDSGLRTASALTVVRLVNGQFILLVSEFNAFSTRTTNAVFRFHPGSLNLNQPGAIQAEITREPQLKGYQNQGWSQGLKAYRGLIFETGNKTPLISSYLVVYQPEDALIQRFINPLKRYPGPGPQIEDLAISDDGTVYVTDESTCLLYSADLLKP